MKRINNILSVIAVATATMLASCSDDTDKLSGSGRLFVHTTVESNIKVESRATVDELNENLILYISGKEGLIRKYKGVSEIPSAGIPLMGGSYVAEAWTGDSVSASWDARFYKAYQPFEISNSDVTLNIRCTIANVLASVQYSDDVDAVLSDYKLTVGHTRGSLTFEGRDERVASFMMPSTSRDLEWKLEGTDLTGKPYTKTGVIKDAKSATQYNLVVTYTPESTDVGGGFIKVVVDAKEVVYDHSITILAPPRIQGVDFDITKTLMAEPGNVGHRALFVTAAAELNSVILDFDELDALLGIEDVDGTGINLLKMTNDIKQLAENAGLDFAYEYDPTTKLAQMKINFSDELMNSLSEGEHQIEIGASVMDNDIEKMTEIVWILNLTNEPVSVVQIPDYNVWATSATVSGVINKEDVTDVEVRYRATGSRADSDWLSVPATLSGMTFTAELTGLQPGTVYEYYAATPDFDASTPQRFTTEAAAQIPNGSFEDWGLKDNKIVIPAANESKLYWDSGNHGSSKMNKNITEQSTDYVHDGQYSACLSSQFVGVGTIGKFAAGNIFIGKYVATDGMDGVLGWGRGFTSRPKALKGYVKYNPAKVEYEDSNAPLKKGDMDQGKIYIALLDESTENYNGEKWPVIIKTKASSRQLFSPSANNVIAYGELLLTKATDSEGLEEFTITLDYYRTDVVPSNIMIVCSASAYGDYFVGGPSVMYLDDFQLIY